MNSLKNIITWCVKIAIGLGSILLIYWRLHRELTPEKTELLLQSFTSAQAYGLLLACIALVPVNWSIESYKWQQITQPVEAMSFGRAMKSVYSGLCVGNFAPGRATEFLAKILFFRPENRATITLLHFAGGMFQLSVTILLGVLAFIYRLQSMQVITGIFWWMVILSSVLFLLFIIFILNFDKVQAWIINRFRKEAVSLPYSFTAMLTSRLVLFSILRYLVFTVQFILVLKLFYQGDTNSNLVASVALYFLLTTILPMISFIEAAIRGAIAILVFNGLNIPEIHLVITAVLVWLINIVLPSVAGYIVIVRENFEFRFFKKT